MWWCVGGTRAPEFRKSARCGISENVGIDDSRGSTRGQLVVRTVEDQWPRFFERFGAGSAGSLLEVATHRGNVASVPSIGHGSGVS
jgi:hypothetical protein